MMPKKRPTQVRGSRVRNAQAEIATEAASRHGGGGHDRRRLQPGASGRRTRAEHPERAASRS